LNVSKNEAFTTSLGNPFQCLTTFTVKKNKNKNKNKKKQKKHLFSRISFVLL